MLQKEDSMKIALIGMPTSGKSTIANVLAKKLNYEVLDVDKSMENNFHSSLQQFIDNYGESKFIEEENNILLTLNYPDNCIISTGGSVIYATQGMQYLKNHGVKFFYLSTPLPILEQRLSTQRNMRGIIMNGATTWAELLLNRDKLYQYYADNIIDTENKQIDSIVQQIITYTTLDNL